MKVDRLGQEKYVFAKCFTLDLQIGHCEIQLAQRLHRTKCPHGEIVTFLSSVIQTLHNLSSSTISTCFSFSLFSSCAGIHFLENKEQNLRERGTTSASCLLFSQFDSCNLCSFS